MKSKIKKFFYICTIVITLLSGKEYISAAQNKVDTAYQNYTATLKKQNPSKDIYTATVKSGIGNKLLLVTTSIFKEQGNNAVSADIYQYVKGKVVYIGNISSTGTSYPLRYTKKYLLAGYHHVSIRMQVKNGMAKIDTVEGIYMEEGTGTINHYKMKNGKQKKVSSKKISRKKAEKIDYYSERNNNGLPIVFQKYKK